jgi:hypothetical protein
MADKPIIVHLTEQHLIPGCAWLLTKGITIDKVENPSPHRKHYLAIYVSGELANSSRWSIGDLAWDGLDVSILNDLWRTMYA